MRAENKNQKGFITTIILIVVAFIALKYILHFDIIEYLKSPQFKPVIQETLKIIGILRGWLKITYDWVINILGRLFNK